MIRIAAKADIPAILDIYAPYILNTTATFEYTVPSLEEFTARFENVTSQFPWLVWEENGTVLGYAYYFGGSVVCLANFNFFYSHAFSKC